MSLCVCDVCSVCGVCLYAHVRLCVCLCVVYGCVWCVCLCMVCGVCESSKRCSRAEIGSILLGGEEARGGTQGLTVAKSNRASTPFT